MMDPRLHTSTVMQQLSELAAVVNADEAGNIGNRVARNYCEALKDYSLDDFIGGVALAKRSLRKKEIPMPSRLEDFIKRFRGDEIKRRGSSGSQLTLTNRVMGGFGAPALEAVISVRPFLQYVFDYTAKFEEGISQTRAMGTFEAIFKMFNEVVMAEKNSDHEELQKVFARIFKWAHSIQDWAAKKYGVGTAEHWQMVDMWVYATRPESTKYGDFSNVDMVRAQKFREGTKHASFPWESMEEMWRRCISYCQTPRLLKDDDDFDVKAINMEIKRRTAHGRIEFHNTNATKTAAGS